VKGTTSPRLLSARRDAIVLAILITAVMMLIWNGSAFFHSLHIGDVEFGREIRLASTALTLNVALILFGWRRYIDLQHEAEMRAEHERRATVLPPPTLLPDCSIAKVSRTPRVSFAPQRANAATIWSSSHSRFIASRRSMTSMATRPETGS
jgi:hypothetical protein